MALLFNQVVRECCNNFMMDILDWADGKDLYRMSNSSFSPTCS